MAVFKKPNYKGGRPPSGKRLVDYLAHHEKREASFIVDVAGSELTPEEALRHIGDGIEGKDFHHTIIGLHRAECDFLQDKLGLSPEDAAKEQGRILVMDISRRTGREAPLAVIHMEREEDGGIRWHYHMIGRGVEPQGLRGEKGHFQKAWDKEMRGLMEGNQKIVDWNAHREWKALREQHQAILKEQRVLQEGYSRARKEHKEATKGVQRMASLNRWTFAAVPGLGLLSEASSITRSRERMELERLHHAERPEIIHRRHQIETEMLRKRYQSRGNGGSVFQELEQKRIDERRDSGLLNTEKVTSLEKAEILQARSRKLRLASRLTLQLVPGLSAAAGITAFMAERKATRIERQFKDKELELIKRGRNSELGTLSAHYKALGMEGGTEHKMRAKEVERRAASATFKVKTRGMDRTAVRRLRQANGKAISVAKRGVTRASGVALEAAKGALRKTQEKAGVTEPHHLDRSIEKHHEAVRPVADAPKQIASQIAKSTVQVGAEAAKTMAAASAKLAIRAASASIKMAGGLVMALPTGGTSLGTASASAAQDLTQGASEAAQEAGKGTLRTAKSSATGVKDVVQSGLRSVMSLGMDALPPAAREALQGIKKSATTTLAAGKDLLTLDIIGAGSNVAAGGMEVAKHAAGSIAHGAKGLPAVARMPLRIAEAVPLAGSLVKVARVGLEVGATVSAGAGLGGAQAQEMEM